MLPAAAGGLPAPPEPGGRLAGVPDDAGALPEPAAADGDDSPDGSFTTTAGVPEIAPFADAGSNQVVLVDAAGTIRGYYDSDAPGALSALEADARKLAREGAGGR